MGVGCQRLLACRWLGFAVALALACATAKAQPALELAKDVSQVALRSYNAMLARFGGEEFIVALPGLGLEDAAAVAEKLRLHLREEPFFCYDVEVPISASISVHELDTRGTAVSIDAALQRADEALYRAKADGRDCVRMSAPTPA